MASQEFKHLVRACQKLFYYGSEMDKRLIEIVMLPYVSLAWRQIPVWLRIIAPAACGKSTHMSLVESYKTSYVIDSFTPKSFISGYRGNNEDPSQLPLMHNKVLLISDESTIMEQRKEDRNLIQAILRKAYDGKVTKAFGNLKHKVEHSASFNILVAATPIVDRYYLYNQALGERFINFRLQIPNRRLITERAVKNQYKNFGFRKKMLAKKVQKHLDIVRNVDFDKISISQKYQNRLIDCASFIALIRTHVTRDSSGRFVTLLPQPEAASRLVQQMLQVAISSAVIRGDKYVKKTHLELAVYTALCSAPSLTIYMLNMMWRTTKKLNRKWHTIKELMVTTHLGQLSTRNVIEDLCIHRVLRMKSARSQGGRLIQYALSKYGMNAIEGNDLFKQYDDGMSPVRGKKKERLHA